jgi:2-aminoethylphosphonate-pyruvate transaminase
MRALNPSPARDSRIRPPHLRRPPPMTPLLLTPGPLTTSEATRRALLDDHGSRDPAFVERFRAVRERLVALLDTQRRVHLRADAGQRHLRRRGDDRHPHPTRRRRARLRERGRMGSAPRRSPSAPGAGSPASPSPRPSPSPLPVSPRPSPPTPRSATSCSSTARRPRALVNPVEAVADVVLAAGRRLLIDAMSSFGALPPLWSRADRRRRVLGEQVPGGCPRPRICAHPRRGAGPLRRALPLGRP